MISVDFNFMLPLLKDADFFTFLEKKVIFLPTDNVSHSSNWLSKCGVILYLLRRQLLKILKIIIPGWLSPEVLNTH